MKDLVTTNFKETEVGLIPEGWEVTPINKLPIEIGDGNYSSKYPKNNELSVFGIPFISAKDLKNGRIRKDDLRCISTELHKVLRKGHIKTGDVLVVTRADVGRTALVTEDFDDANINAQLVFLRSDNEKIHNKFLYYLLSSETYFDLMRNYSSGSAQSQLPIKIINEIPILIPSNNEQNKIAEILSSLDDKIELNRAINANLEKVAAALFKKWFVDIGDELPDGWRMGTLGKEFEIVMGQSPAGDTYNENGDGLPFYQGRTDFGFRFPSHRIYCTDPKRTAGVLDTLVSVRAPVGDVNMTYEECCIGRGVGAIRKKDCSSYTFYTIKSLQKEISKFDSEGTVFGSINKDSLANLPCTVPLKERIDGFEKVASEIDGQILNFSREIENLQAIRDLLLPRLMNGKIRVKI